MFAFFASFWGKVTASLMSAIISFGVSLGAYIPATTENAKNYYNEQINFIIQDEEKRLNSIKELSNILNIDNLSRIEIFDNSNLFGNFNVSGMVVFIDGRPEKNEYRKFKITNDVNDDYGTMKEVLYRRYFRVLKENLKKPDLIIVDGGIGQLNIAREVIE